MKNSETLNSTLKNFTTKKNSPDTKKLENNSNSIKVTILDS